jgi:hypothetical protein
MEMDQWARVRRKVLIEERSKLSVMRGGGTALGNAAEDAGALPTAGNGAPRWRRGDAVRDCLRP